MIYLLLCLAFLPVIFILLRFQSQQRKECTKYTEMAKTNDFTFYADCKNRDGFNIVRGSVIASGGDINDSYYNYLTGTRNGEFFSAIGYTYVAGRGLSNQTIICLENPSNRKPNISIIDTDLLGRCERAGKARVSNGVRGLFESRAIVIDKGDQVLDHTFLDVVTNAAKSHRTNIECIDGRILFYSNGKLLPCNKFIETLDKLIQLKNKISTANNRNGIDSAS